MPADNPPQPPPAPTAPPPETDELDPTVRLLFETAESEASTQAEHKPGKTLVQTIDEPNEEQPPPKEEPKPEEKKDEPPPETEKPVKVRRRSATPTPPPAPPAPPPPKEEAKGPTPEQQFEEGLLDEERDQLELARYAEQSDAKYKGYAGKVTKFLKDHQDYLAKNPEATDPGTDAAEAYQAWLAKNNVALPAREMRALEHRRIAETAKAEAMKEAESKFGELHDDNFRRDTEPRIKQEADEFFRKLAAEALPLELTKAAQEEGIEKARAKFPFEFRVAGEEMSQAASDIEEFRRMTTNNPKTGRALKSYDPASKQHERIVSFIREQCQTFKDGVPNESAAQRAARLKLQVNDEGKTFVTRDEFFTMKPEERTQFWTFTNDQITTLAHYRTKERITNRIASEFRQRETDGWVRKAADPSPAPAPTPQPPGAPPAPRPSPIPGNTPPDEKPDRTMAILMGEDH